MIDCKSSGCFSNRACSERLAQEILLVNLVAAVSHTLPSVRVEGNFSTATSFTLPARYGGGAVHLGTLNSVVAAGCPGPNFQETSVNLVDALAEFVFPSESVSRVESAADDQPRDSIFNLQ